MCFFLYSIPGWLISFFFLFRNVIFTSRAAAWRKKNSLALALIQNTVELFLPLSLESHPHPHHRKNLSRLRNPLWLTGRRKSVLIMQTYQSSRAALCRVCVIAVLTMPGSVLCQCRLVGIQLRPNPANILLISDLLGNTIFLALGASGQPDTHPYGWLKSLTSILFFLLGCLCFASTRLIHPKARGTLGVSFFLQSLCLIVAAALVQSGVIPEPVGLQTLGGINFIELVPLAFLAFQSGGQMVTSRLLGFNEVPTTVLTSVYCDLISDPKVLGRDNIKRNRRCGAVLMILLGGIAGGWISRSKAGMSVSLWVAAAIKLGIACSWSLWKPKIPTQL